MINILKILWRGETVRDADIETKHQIIPDAHKREMTLAAFVIFGCESSPISRNVRALVRPLVS